MSFGNFDEWTVTSYASGTHIEPRRYLDPSCLPKRMPDENQRAASHIMAAWLNKNGDPADIAKHFGLGVGTPGQLAKYAVSIDKSLAKWIIYENNVKHWKPKEYVPPKPWNDDPEYVGDKNPSKRRHRYKDENDVAKLEANVTLKFKITDISILRGYRLFKYLYFAKRDESSEFNFKVFLNHVGLDMRTFEEWLGEGLLINERRTRPRYTSVEKIAGLLIQHHKSRGRSNAVEDCMIRVLRSRGREVNGVNAPKEIYSLIVDKRFTLTPQSIGHGLRMLYQIWKKKTGKGPWVFSAEVASQLRKIGRKISATTIREYLFGISYPSENMAYGIQAALKTHKEERSEWRKTGKPVSQYGNSDTTAIRMIDTSWAVKVSEHLTITKENVMRGFRLFKHIRKAWGKEARINVLATQGADILSASRNTLRRLFSESANPQPAIGDTLAIYLKQHKENKKAKSLSEKNNTEVIGMSKNNSSKSAAKVETLTQELELARDENVALRKELERLKTGIADATLDAQVQQTVMKETIKQKLAAHMKANFTTGDEATQQVVSQLMLELEHYKKEYERLGGLLGKSLPEECKAELEKKVADCLKWNDDLIAENDTLKANKAELEKKICELEKTAAETSEKKDAEKAVAERDFETEKAVLNSKLEDLEKQLSECKALNESLKTKNGELENLVFAKEEMLKQADEMKSRQGDVVWFNVPKVPSLDASDLDGLTIRDIKEYGESVASMQKEAYNVNEFAELWAGETQEAVKKYADLKARIASLWEAL